MLKKLWLVIVGTAATAAFAKAPLAGQAMPSAMQRAVAPATVAPEGKKGGEQVENAPKKGAPADPQDSIKIGVIKSLAFSGATDFVEKERVHLILERELVDGKEKTIGDFKAAAEKLRLEMSARGYYLVSVNPASANAYNKKTGELALDVDCGRFGVIDVDLAERDGWHWYSQEQVAKRLKRINRNDYFNYFKLRAALAELNGHPDLLADTKISVRNKLYSEDKADSQFTRFADIALTVDDSCPFHFVWDINNYGMEEIDEWQTSLTVQYLNLTRADDVLTVSPAMSFNGDLMSISASYMRPFDWWRGMSGTVYGGYSKLDTDKILPSLALEGTGWFAGFNWSANMFDDENRNVAITAGILYRYMEDEWTVAAYKARKRRAGILPITWGASYADKKGDWLGGRDFFNIGYTINLASTEDKLKDYSDKADEHYMILRAGWQRLQPLFAGNLPDEQKWRAWSLFSRIEGQYTHNDLISSERLAYGGYNCLRGYRTRGYVGDYGVYGTLELRTPVLCNAFANLFCDMNGKAPFDRFQFLLFLDAGWIRFNETYPNMEESEFLYSAGFGVRAGLTKYTSLNFDVAFPLGRGYAHENDDDIELYLSVKVQW